MVTKPKPDPDGAARPPRMSTQPENDPFGWDRLRRIEQQREDWERWAYRRDLFLAACIGICAAVLVMLVVGLTGVWLTW